MQLHLLRLELARGYDGPLRGMPEPTLLFGIYRVRADRVTLLERSLHRLTSRGPHPERIDVEDARVEARAPRVKDMRLLVLALALEEDSGEGVAALYAELEAPDRLALWAADAQQPDPVSLADWAKTTSPAAPVTTTVHLVDAERDLRDAKLGDDWVGAAVFCLDDEKRSREERRMRFASADGRNDWTAIVEVRVV